MDSISAILIMIFVVSIFGAVTKGPNDYKSARSSLPKEETIQVTLPSSTIEPSAWNGEKGDHAFAAGYADGVEDKIYKFIMKKGQKVKASGAAMMVDSIIKYCKQYDVNPRAVAALIAAESRFNSQAISRSGAIGLGQLLPSTARHLGVADPYNIDQNVMGTTRYMRSMLDCFKNYSPRLNYALAGYKEGPNNVLRRGNYTYESQKYIDLIMDYYGKI